MRRSERRLLTTHTGSLPRPPDLVTLMLAREAGEPVDEALLARRVAEATREVVTRQADAHIDVVNDGEMSKPSYSTYVKDRLSGFDGEGRPPSGGTVEAEDFPGYARAADPSRAQLRFPTCSGPVTVRDGGAVQRDIDVLRASLTGQETDVFLSSVSPGDCPLHGQRVLPQSRGVRLRARRGHAARVPGDRQRGAGAAGGLSRSGVRAHQQRVRVAVVGGVAQGRANACRCPESRAAGASAESVRLHLCWGNYAGPHHRDVPLADILDIALSAQVGGLSFEAANPRHAHEWAVFRDVKLPDGFVLIPGVIESCSLYIEHPQLVAQRLQHFVDVAGFENVIASTDCGFGTFVSSAPMHPGIVWAKLGAMAEGAAMVQR